MDYNSNDCYFFWAIQGQYINYTVKLIRLSNGVDFSLQSTRMALEVSILVSQDHSRKGFLEGVVLFLMAPKGFPVPFLISSKTTSLFLAATTGTRPQQVHGPCTVVSDIGLYLPNLCFFLSWLITVEQLHGSDEIYPTVGGQGDGPKFP